jgi:glycosyltransferase involved in cell wall biosynthesis
MLANTINTIFKRKQIKDHVSFNWMKFQDNSINYSTDKDLLFDTVPVSVVLTTIKKRKEFVNSFVLPSIQANNPAEIIIIDDEELGIQEKRNKGASLAKQDYIFFCDDDVIIPKNHLKILHESILGSDYSFAYTDYQAIVFDESSHAFRKNYYHSASHFDLKKLKRNNFIDTCSLVKKSDFCGFDPKIKRFQDWDLWLTLSLNGHTGIYVEETGIMKFYFDSGISSSKNLKYHRDVILKKHGLL